MALLEVRRRGSTFLFFAVVVAHIVLISAQVTSKSGVPVLQAVTFGLVAQVQRAGAAVITGVTSLWTRLRRSARRPRRERPAQTRSGGDEAAAAAGACPRAADRRALSAARPEDPHPTRNAGRRGHRRAGDAGVPHRHDRQGHRGGHSARHGRARAERRRRPRHRAQRQRLQSAAADRSQRRRRGAGRAIALAGRGPRRGRCDDAAGLRQQHRGHPRGRHHRDVGRRRHLSEGLSHRQSGEGRAERRRPTRTSRCSRPWTSRRSKTCWWC